MIGIYKITSPSGKVYIGQAIDIERRKKSYIRLHCKNQTKLYNSLIKYGFTEHSFEIIEECITEQLNERERYWQDFYKVLSKNGLNLKLTETADKSGRLSKETKKKIGENINYTVRTLNTDYKKRSEKLNKPILQYSLDGKLIKKWESIKEAGQTLKILRGSISKCLNGGGKSAGGFIWRYSTDIILDSIEVNISTIKKPIIQYDKEGVFIKEWNSIKEVGETLNINQSSIIKCCKDYLKSVGGYVWRYKTEISLNKIQIGKVGYESASESKKKEILQFTKHGVLIQEWNSGKEAGDVLGICRGSISSCLKGKFKTAGGFIWKYKIV